MKHFRHAIYAAAALGVAFSPFLAAAQAAPFIIIRFNQARMYYEQPLYNAVSKAVGMKQDVLFDIVGVAPRTGDSGKDSAWQERSRANVQKVIGTLNSMGVPSSRLTVQYMQVEGLRFDEVRVAAR